MPQDTPTRENGAKSRQILDGARAAFLELGYDGTSVDEIARRAAVSKPTVYAHFADKRALFAAVILEQCQHHRNRMFPDEPPAPGEPIRDTLRRTAGLYAALLLSPVSLGLLRLATAEAPRFPELGQALYDAGPNLARQRLQAILSRAVAQGDLEIEDLDLAADQFAELCQAGLTTRRLLLATRPTARELTRVVEAAVTTFLRAYTPTP